MLIITLYIKHTWLCRMRKLSDHIHSWESLKYYSICNILRDHQKHWLSVGYFGATQCCLIFIKQSTLV